MFGSVGGTRKEAEVISIVFPKDVIRKPPKLKGYPPGSFIVIPAGIPHLVATKEGPVIVQLSGKGKFGTDYLEK